MLLTRRHILALSASLAASPVCAGAPPVVFAAASLKAALDEISRVVIPMRISYGGSGALARQIIQGAPADLFLSAHPDWMDVVEKAGRVTTEHRADLLGNRLVIVGQVGANQIALKEWAPAGRVAMGFLKAVPAGQYGQAAFEGAGVWEAVKPHVVEFDNVRAALALVVRGELPYAVVYASDAKLELGVNIIHEFAEHLHPPIRYPLAALDDAGLAAFDTLQTSAARVIFERAGFEVL